MAKTLEVVQGDSLTLGFRVSSTNGPVDFTRPGVKLHATITDPSGRRVLARFKIIPIDLVNGEFRIHLDQAGYNLRGKNIWSVRYERDDVDTMTTLAGGTFIVKVGAK